MSERSSNVRRRVCALAAALLGGPAPGAGVAVAVADDPASPGRPGDTGGSAGGFVDRSAAVGLGPDVLEGPIARVCLADLDDDGFPDAVIDRHLVFMNRPDAASPIGRRFEPLDPDRTGLPEPVRGGSLVFVDLDGDGVLDALHVERVETGDERWEDHGRRTGWSPGRGDGTFSERRAIDTPAKPTVAVAAGDVDGDGRLDLFLGNGYARPGRGYEGATSDLLLGRGDERTGGVDFVRCPLPEDDHGFDAATDPGGRPTYGAAIVRFDDALGPLLLELGYGRRWNRAWSPAAGAGGPIDHEDPCPPGWIDVAPRIGFDGDAIRHGRHPAWLAERAKTDPRFDRDDEPPFRANGNTFDVAAGDLDGDGHLDLLVSEITHGWAGESSDRTRLLRSIPAEGGSRRFVEHAPGDLDRVPAPEEGRRNWNQGDLFAEFADLDHDGRLDVIVSSGDYPDDQRLRIFLQDADGRFVDRTEVLGVDHDGSQQISLGDVDGDGDLDLLVGQTFFRYSAEMREGRSPRARLYVNELADDRPSITLRLRGDGSTVNTFGLGAVVRGRQVVGGEPVRFARHLTGVGGHAGKQHDLVVHLGLAGAGRVTDLEVVWPAGDGLVQSLGPLGAGRYVLRFGEGPVRVDADASPGR